MTRPNMSRGNTGYLLGIALLAATFFVVHHMDLRFEFSHVRQAMYALVVAALVFILWSLGLHSKRSTKPWSVNAATVNTLYAAGLVTGFGAMLLSHSLV